MIDRHRDDREACHRNSIQRRSVSRVLREQPTGLPRLCPAIPGKSAEDVIVAQDNKGSSNGGKQSGDKQSDKKDDSSNKR